MSEQSCFAMQTVVQPVEFDPAYSVAAAFRRLFYLKVRHNFAIDIIDDYRVVGADDGYVVKRPRPFVGSGIAGPQPFCADVDEGGRVQGTRFADETEPGRLFENDFRPGPDPTPGRPPLTPVGRTVEELLPLIDMCQPGHKSLFLVQYPTGCEEREIIPVDKMIGTLAIMWITMILHGLYCSRKYNINAEGQTSRPRLTPCGPRYKLPTWEPECLSRHACTTE